MYCNLIGLSPCDIILQGISGNTVKSLLQLLNNRFDIKFLVEVRAEFDHIVGVLDKMILDYEDNEDRRMAKRLHVSSMTSFGDGLTREQAEAHLRFAKKTFQGRIETKRGVIEVKHPETRKNLETLYGKRNLLREISTSIVYSSFSDNVYFGRPLTWWANSRSHTWLSVYAAERIERKDSLQSLRSDAVDLLSYVTSPSEKEKIEVKLPSLSDIEVRHAQLCGEALSGPEQELVMKFISALESRDLSEIGLDAVTALSTAFVYCLICSRQCNEEVAAELDKCGIVFMNSSRAEFMLACLADYTLVPERRIVLRNLEYGDSYETILSAIIAACDNSVTPIGAKLSKGGE